jgi:uncharacterized protein involved in outer membrane biogenesis
VDTGNSKAKARHKLQPRSTRLLAIAGTLVALAIVLLMLFDWNWLRPSLEHFLSERAGRTVTVGDLRASLNRQFEPTVEMRNVYVQNASWADQRPMAVAGAATFTFSLDSVRQWRPIISKVTLLDADVDLERQADGRANWRLTHPEDRSPDVIRILSVETSNSKVSLSDRVLDLDFLASASSLDSAAGQKQRAEARPLTMKVIFSGVFRGAKFSGDAWCGDIITFHEAGRFPVRGYAIAESTRIDVDGEMSDAAKLIVADAKVRIAGPTLSSLYPFLLLPLPETHTYDVEGRLQRTGEGYKYTGFHGRIGKTDIAGDADYSFRAARPLLKADLRSKKAELADLGPLIGIEDQAHASSAAPGAVILPSKSARRAGPSVATPSAIVPGSHVIPVKAFNTERLTAMDAHVTLAAQAMHSVNIAALESMSFTADLNNGVLQLKPLDFGLAGGHAVGVIMLDANQQPIASRITVNLRDIRLERLLPSAQVMAKSAGAIGARLQLSSHGDSISAALGSASGSLMVVMDGGRISNMLDAKIALNVGKIIKLKITGDRDIAINCAALAFRFENGLGHSHVILFDTEQTRTEGKGTVDLRDENVDFLLQPHPKQPGILSLRSPLRINGSFTDPKYSVDKGAILLRAGGAAALGAVNPLAFFVPLIEPGKAAGNRCTAVLGDMRGATANIKPERRTTPAAN